MSGKRYEVFMAPSAHRIYKKSDPPLKQKINGEAKKLAEDPYRYEELKGPLKGIRSYHFEYSKAEFRIAYQILEEKNQMGVAILCHKAYVAETFRSPKVEG